MKQQALIRGRVVDENRKPLSNVLITASQYSKTTPRDGLFEIPVVLEKETYVGINVSEVTNAFSRDGRPEHLQGRCYRQTRIPAKTLSEGIVEWGDIILGFPTGVLLCEVVEPSGRPFTPGELALEMRNNALAVCVTELDAFGKARLECLDPTDVLTVTVRKDCTSESKLWTTWTFPPVTPSNKPIRLVLEERLRRVRPRPEL
jgi:hypothetical protein